MVPLNVSIDFSSSANFELWLQVIGVHRPGLLPNHVHGLPDLDFIESSLVVPGQDDVEFNKINEIEVVPVVVRHVDWFKYSTERILSSLTIASICP